MSTGHYLSVLFTGGFRDGGKIHGCQVEGLHVVDASDHAKHERCWSRKVPRANTNLPTLMLAERIVAGLN